MRRLLVSVLSALCWVAVAAASPQQHLRDLDSYPHARQVEASVDQVVDHQVGLGPIEKVRDVWRLKESERLSGELQSFTWQIVDGFTSREVADELTASIPDKELLFSCEGRSCGSGAQWANRIFGQRILYGLVNLQRYQVYRLRDGNTEYRLVIFDAARTADRQYLHVELLRVAD